MIFGEIKGLGADRSWHHAGYVLFLIICVVSLVGVMSGYHNEPANGLDPYRWDLKRVIYFLAEFVAFAGGVWCASKYREADMRLGAILFLAGPPILVLAGSARMVGFW